MTTYAGSPGVEGVQEGLLANTRLTKPTAITSRGDGTLIVVTSTGLFQLNATGTSGIISSGLDGWPPEQDMAAAAVAYSAPDQCVLVMKDIWNSIVSYEPEGELTDGTLTAYRNQWTSSNLVPVAMQGTYNASIRPNQSNVTYPQGDGYTQVSISSTGVAKGAGKAADGTSFTFATIMSAGGDVLLHAMMYKNTGSVQGVCRIDGTTLGITSEDTGGLVWHKIPQPLNSTDRSYKGGLYYYSLMLEGTKFTPGSLHSNLGLGAGPALLELDFGPTRITTFKQSFTLTAPNAVSMTAPVKLLTLKIDPKTGIFTGTFKAADPVATATFSGIMNGTEVNLSNGLTTLGRGHYLIPDSEVNTSAVYSGHVRMQQVAAP